MAYSLRDTYKLHIGSAEGWSGSLAMSESPNLYVEIKTGDSKAQMTKGIEGNILPVWSQQFLIIGKIASIIYMSIKHNAADRHGEDTCIGRVGIPVGDLLAQCEDSEYAILSLGSAATEEHRWSMASIKVQFSRLTNAENSVQGGLIDGLFEHASSLLLRFYEIGELADLENSILKLRLTSKFTDDGHPDWLTYFAMLGVAELERYQRLGELKDLESSIQTLKVASGLTAEGHPDKAFRMSNLGLSQPKRYERLGEITDLEDSLSSLRDAVRITNDDHPEKMAHCSNLAMSSMRRYERLGELADVEESICNLRKAVQFTKDGDPQEPNYLTNLGNGLRTRYLCLGELNDLEDSISNLQKAVQYTEDGHPNKPMYLSNLSMGLQSRYESCGDLADVYESILNLRQAVQLTDDGHPNKPMYIGNLGSSQVMRYEHIGEMLDVDESIRNFRQAVQLTDDGHPNKPMYLGNLGSSQLKRYEHFGRMPDADESILNLRQAVQLTEDGHPNKPIYLGNLGICQLKYHEQFGKPKDVEDAILNLQQAVHCTDDGHPNKPRYLANLGCGQSTRYQYFGKLQDVEDSILNLQKAAQLTEDGHTAKLLYLSNLGGSQCMRYDHFGKTADIEDSVSNLRKAVECTDDGHPSKPMYLSNLAGSQMRRYSRFGELADIANATLNTQKAVQLTTDGHPSKPIYLANLASQLMDLYYINDKPEAIEESILNWKNAVQLTEDGHINKAAYLSGLGLSQSCRFELLAKAADIEESISNLRAAVQLTDEKKPIHLLRLSGSQLERFKCFGDLKDIEDSISNLRMSVTLMEEDCADRAKHLCALGNALHLRFEQLGGTEDLVACIAAFREAAKSNTAYPDHAFFSARKWAEISHHSNDLASAMDGYRTALETLPKVAWIGLSTASRQNALWIQDTETLSCLSATCAIHLGHLEEAVELLNLGRSVIWQQESSFRSDFEELRDVDRELADQIENVGLRLSARKFTRSFSDKGVHHVMDLGAEDFSMERRLLAAEWDELVDRARQLPQCQNFLRPVPFSQLRQAAVKGQAIIINASKYGVDAMIVDAVHPLTHVPLPDADAEVLSELAGDIVLRQPTHASEAQRQSYNTRYLKRALRAVWNDILIPIFNKLGIQLNGKSADVPQRRIWWYPTSTVAFIPIHAAGPGKGEVDTSRLVISSYVTTLNSLLKAHKKRAQGIVGQMKLLAVSQSDTPGQESLPLAVEEVDKVVQMVSLAGWPKDDITCMSASHATVSQVSGALNSSHWVHFACHGMQHQESGKRNALALHDGELDLGEIASKRLSVAQFAFLSACHTAAALEGLPGEAMHLAGGLQFAGFPSVIATMWGISDKDAPIVASRTYQYLFRNGMQNCDPSEAATALNHAVFRLREDPGVTVDRWAPFIHFGI